MEKTVYVIYKETVEFTKYNFDRWGSFENFYENRTDYYTKSISSTTNKKQAQKQFNELCKTLGNAVRTDTFNGWYVTVFTLDEEIYELVEDEWEYRCTLSNDFACDKVFEGD